MKIRLVLALIIIQTTVHAQFFSNNVDRIPIEAICYNELEIEEALECTDTKLDQALFETIDTTVCPSTDSTLQYGINLVINAKGTVDQATISHYKADESCLAHLSEKLTDYANSVTFEPAIKGKKKEGFRLMRTFIYPKTDSLYAPDSSGIYGNIKVMPRFKSDECESMIATARDKKACGENKMLQFMYKSLKYPAEARDRGIQGTTVVSFIINEEGRIEDETIVREIGGGCGKASLKVIKAMNQLGNPFIPGMVDNKPVKVKYTLPFRFKLQ